MKRLMLSSVPLYERTTMFRIYEHNVIPGLFQTAEYSAAMLRYFVDFLDIPDDIEQAVETRMERQRILYSGQRRFVVVIEEQALLKPVGTDETMIGQLDRLLAVMSLPRVLLAVMSLPRVSLGIIPLTRRTAFPSTGFWIYDDTLVGVETPTASLEITQPREIALYGLMFTHLQESAVYGAAARNKVNEVLVNIAGATGLAVEHA
nr:Unknown Function [uncultured bacterium]